MTPLVILLGRARTLGFTLVSVDGRLRVSGPREHGDLARALLSRKDDVLPLVDIYGGRRRLLDWKSAAVRDPAPCTVCGRGALLRDPYDKVPLHKTCAERVIRWGMADTGLESAAA